MRNAAHCVTHVQLDLKSESGFSCVVFSPLLSGIVVYDLSFRRKARAVKFLVSKREGGGDVIIVTGDPCVDLVNWG